MRCRSCGRPSDYDDMAMCVECADALSEQAEEREALALLPEPTVAQLWDAIFMLAAECGDLSLCPHYTHSGAAGSQGKNTCGFGCTDEPECQTCTPSEGWPLERVDPEVRAAAIERSVLAFNSIEARRTERITAILGGEEVVDDDRF